MTIWGWFGHLALPFPLKARVTNHLRAPYGGVYFTKNRTIVRHPDGDRNNRAIKSEKASDYVLLVELPPVKKRHVFSEVHIASAYILFIILLLETMNIYKKIA